MSDREGGRRRPRLLDNFHISLRDGTTEIVWHNFRSATLAEVNAELVRRLTEQIGPSPRIDDEEAPR